MKKLHICFNNVDNMSEPTIFILVFLGFAFAPPFLEWLGMKSDAFYRQSEREAIYKKYIKELVDKKLAYVSKEEPKEEGQRDSVIRFKNTPKIFWIMVFL